MTKDARDERAIEIAVRLREVRETLKLSQKGLATALNISGPTISDLENGKLFLNFEYIYNINRKYGVNLYYLLFGEGEMFEVKESKLTQRLEKLIRSSKEAEELLDYFEKSRIIRYSLYEQFVIKMTQEKDNIEKEISNKAGK